MLLDTANVCSAPILSTLMMVIRSSEMSLLTKATWHHIPADSILENNGIFDNIFAQFFDRIDMNLNKCFGALTCIMENLWIVL
jgi:hypothetical protein